MTDVQAKLGHMLLKGLVNLREQKGDITLQDVGGMFMQMSTKLNPSSGSIADQFMHQEISKLANYITTAKKEIFAISANEKTDAALVDASAHLDEVIKATETASNTIMDAADEIQALTKGIGGEKERQIMDASHRIYDACNFQDITGQRITKVINLLANIEERLTNLNTLFGETEKPDESNIVKMPTTDKDLLNGPQLSSQAASQDEIDKLFASLGGKN